MTFEGPWTVFTAPSVEDRPFGCPPDKAVIIISLPGTPAGKGRPRFSRRTGHAYTPEKTRSYESMLQGSAIEAMAGKPPIQGPVRVRVKACFPVPASWSQKKKAAALLHAIRPTSRPDWENIAKMLDALNGVVWRDDAQVVEGTITKSYTEAPMLRVTVEEI